MNIKFTAVVITIFSFFLFVNINAQSEKESEITNRLDKIKGVVQKVIIESDDGIVEFSGDDAKTLFKRMSSDKKVKKMNYVVDNDMKVIELDGDGDEDILLFSEDFDSDFDSENGIKKEVRVEVENGEKKVTVKTMENGEEKVETYKGEEADEYIEKMKSEDNESIGLDIWEDDEGHKIIIKKDIKHKLDDDEFDIEVEEGKDKNVKKVIIKKRKKESEKEE